MNRGQDLSLKVPDVPRHGRLPGLACGDSHADAAG